MCNQNFRKERRQQIPGGKPAEGFIGRIVKNAQVIGIDNHLLNMRNCRKIPVGLQYPC